MIIPIYLYTNKINKKQYVGQAQDLHLRHLGHLSNAKHSYSASCIDLAINKYGIENFTLEIIEYVNEEFSNEAEKFWIADLNTLVPNGYNIRPGGKTTRGWKHTEETKQKIANAHLGEKSHMFGRVGEAHPFFGRKHTEESIQKMSDVKMGKNNPNYGKPMSEQQKTKISKAMTGENNPNFGKRVGPSRVGQTWKTINGKRTWIEK
jgi:group I intron endonuclease